ncbi:hypothetical protein FHL15_010769 [Xylaria flabelliformis]|uniref:Zn(2)-C6 fungal-type domain-containing protein n=1 Tax=Xylaria flabelliformis TaxID=2512241 RepID=A0A553HK57_9PEZI|nr:hypothetical protein FHL15_010769 [Xylaria flabelliformis]
MSHSSPGFVSLDARQFALYGRACTGCAKAKCRCIVRGTAGPGNSCERCARLGRECRPRKRPVDDERRPISERRARKNRTTRLEEKLEDLIDILMSQTTTDGDGGKNDDGRSKRSGDGFRPRPTDLIINEIQTSAVADTSSADMSPQPSTIHRDRRHIATSPHGPMLTMVESGATTHAGEYASSPSATFERFSATNMISPPSQAQAEETLVLFRDNHLRMFPFTYISPDTTAAQLQRERPHLWLNIRSLCTKSPSQQSALFCQCRELLVKKIFVDGERNLDLLQGLLVLLAWNMHNFDRKPFLRTAIHMAIAMVDDMRLRSPVHDHLSKECNCPRTSASMFLRSQSMRWTPHMRDCLQKVADNPECPEDSLLVTMTQTHRLLEDVAQATWQSPQAEECGMQNQHSINYVNSLRQSLQQIRNTLPQSLLGNKVALSYLDATDMMICNLPFWNSRPLTGIRLSTNSTSSSSRDSRSIDEPVYNPPDLDQIKAHYAAISAAKTVLGNLVSFEPADYVGFSLPIVLHLFQAIQILYRMALTQDHAVVRDNVDLPATVDQIAARYVQAAEVYGFETERDAAGNEVTSFYNKCAVMLRTAAPIRMSATGMGKGSDSRKSHGIRISGQYAYIYVNIIDNETELINFEHTYPNQP